MLKTQGCKEVSDVSIQDGISNGNKCICQKNRSVIYVNNCPPSFPTTHLTIKLVVICSGNITPICQVKLTKSLIIKGFNILSNKTMLMKDQSIYQFCDQLQKVYEWKI